MRFKLFRARQLFRAVMLGFALALLGITTMTGRAVGQAHVDQGGTVGIQNEEESTLFHSLICMCGCPRETLGTCTCGYASERRAELREMLGQGIGVQAVITAYEKRFGTESLAIPPNRGIAPIIWLLPIVLLIAGAFFVIRMLRRWSNTATPAQAAAVVAGESVRDNYDDRLDEELRELDKE